MTIYTVHAPTELDGQSIEAAERFLFVKEGFCWPALVVPLFWLLFRRMWIVLAFFLAALVGIEVLRRLTGFAGTPVLYVLLALFMGVTGNDLRRWMLARRGYGLIDVIEAGSRDEAEIRAFHGELLPVAVQPSTPPPPPPALIAPTTSSDIIGLFPTAGTAR